MSAGLRCVVLSISLVACALVTLPASAAERLDPAVVTEDTTLHTSASPSSSVVTRIAQGTTVEVTGLSKRWARVRLEGGGKGWVLTSHIQMGTTGEDGDGAGWFRNLTGWLSPKRKQTTTASTATIGIRGLQREDIENAQPNLVELARMEDFRASAKSARRHAERHRLVAIGVAYMESGPGAATAASGAVDDDQ